MEQFPILAWDFVRESRFGKNDLAKQIESIAECNFTIAGFVEPSALPFCEDSGISAIVVDDWQDGTAGKWNLPSDEIYRRVESLVKRSSDSQAVVGYYIADEPGASAFGYLGTVVEAVKALAPGKLAYLNIFPDYATLGAKDISQLETDTYEEYVRRYMDEVKPEVLSYDNYQVQFSKDLKDDAKAKSYYRNLIMIRGIAKEYNVPFWNTVSSNQIRPITPIPSMANLLFQAYSTLAAGGKGICWYTYYSGGYGYAPYSEQQKCKTQTWYYLQEVNRQLKILGPIMSSLSSIGLYFTSPTLAAEVPALPGMLVESVDTTEPLMIGEFISDDGTEYVMVVNCSLQNTAKLVVTPKTGLVVDGMVSSVDGSLQPVKEDIWLVAGQGILLRIRR